MQSSNKRGQQEYPKTEISHRSGQSKNGAAKQLIIIDDFTVIEVSSNKPFKIDDISTNPHKSIDIKGEKISVNNMIEGYQNNPRNLSQFH